MTQRVFGVTVAIKASHVQDVLKAGGKAALSSAVRETAAQALEGLKHYVGGAPLLSEPAVDFRGPEDDPIQGLIYAVSIAAMFDTEALGVDSPARLLMLQEQAPGAGAQDIAVEGRG